MWKRLSTSALPSTTLRDEAQRFSAGSCALAEQRAGLKNLHQYPHARYKSLVRDRQRFARNWFLTAGNNYELVHEIGHEREATECFAEYAQDSQKDMFLFSTNRLADLPPRERLNAIVGIMQSRWKVKDGNRGFDKARLLLQALECFSEMRLSGQVSEFDALPEPDQDTFLQYVDGCARFAQACSHSHPEAVSILLRASQICEEMRCSEKRDEMIHITEMAAQRMDRAYAFNRPHDKFRPAPPSLTENSTRMFLKNRTELEQRFKDKAPHVLKKPPRTEYLRIHQHKREYLHQMKDDDRRLELLRLNARRNEE